MPVLPPLCALLVSILVGGALRCRYAAPLAPPLTPLTTPLTPPNNPTHRRYAAAGNGKPPPEGGGTGGSAGAYMDVPAAVNTGSAGAAGYMDVAPFGQQQCGRHTRPESAIFVRNYCNKRPLMTAHAYLRVNDGFCLLALCSVVIFHRGG